MGGWRTLMRKKKPKMAKANPKRRNPRDVTDATMPGRRITAKDAGYLSDRCFVLTMMDLEKPIPIPKNRRRRPGNNPDSIYE